MVTLRRWLLATGCLPYRLHCRWAQREVAALFDAPWILEDQ